VAVDLGTLKAYGKQQAEANGIPWNIFDRQINQESTWDPTAGWGRGPDLARGIAQIISIYHPGVDVWDPMASLAYAAQLDARELATYGSYELMLVAYNGGPGAIAAWRAGTPYGESTRYVNIIMGGGGGELPFDPGQILEPITTLLAPITKVFTDQPGLGLMVGLILGYWFFLRDD
jgi:soluble lytic murein transglycosylase-like protein